MVVGEIDGGGEESMLGVLSSAMSDPEYLAGMEPEGWDFSNWAGFDFREIGGWILREKFFGIATMDSRMLSLQIVQIDPEQFPVKDVKVGFVIAPVTSKDVPTVLIGVDQAGNERVLTNGQTDYEGVLLEKYFAPLVSDVRRMYKNDNSETDEGYSWAKFMVDVLAAKRVFPDDRGPTDELVRQELDLPFDHEVTVEDVLYAERGMLEQEMLMIGLADFVI